MTHTYINSAFIQLTVTPNPSSKTLYPQPTKRLSKKSGEEVLHWFTQVRENKMLLLGAGLCISFDSLSNNTHP